MSGTWELMALAAKPVEVQACEKDFKDDMTGQSLDGNLVAAARKQEMEFFLRKEVWVKVPRGTAKAVTGRQPIPVRWVDVNKGDDIHPEYRSRLVAKDIRFKGVESVFAAMPPVEAVRTVASLLATALPGENFGRQEKAGYSSAS